MQNIIKIQIPDQLKKQFEQDKNLLPHHPNIKENLSKFKNYLENDNILEIIKLINDIHDHIDFESKEYHSTPRQGFYEQITKWFDFALKQLMNEINVDTNNILKTTDMYSSICFAAEQLATNNADNIEELIKNTVDLVIEEKEGIDDNPQIKNMCSLFINIGKGNIIPEEFADISYETFLTTTKSTNLSDNLKSKNI